MSEPKQTVGNRIRVALGGSDTSRSDVVRLVELCDPEGTVLHVAPLPEALRWPQIVVWTMTGETFPRHFLQAVPGRRATTRGEQIGRYIMTPAWTVPVVR